jgi:hypothetical protein
LGAESLGERYLGLQLLLWGVAAMNPGWGKLAANSYSEIPFIRNAQTLRNLGTALKNAAPDVNGAIPFLAEKLVQVFRGEVSAVFAQGEPARELQVVLNGKPVLWQASYRNGRPIDWPLHTMLASAVRALRKELDSTDAQKASAELFATAETLYLAVEPWLDSLFADGQHDAAPVLTLDTRGIAAAKRTIHAEELHAEFSQRVVADKPRSRSTAQNALGRTLESAAAEAQPPPRTKRRKTADNGKAGGSSI